MYDYNNGRFLSVDPFIQNPGSTQSLNPYTYIFNNPLSGVDPTGYMSVNSGFQSYSGYCGQYTGCTGSSGDDKADDNGLITVPVDSNSVGSNNNKSDLNNQKSVVSSEELKEGKKGKSFTDKMIEIGEGFKEIFRDPDTYIGGQIVNEAGDIITESTGGIVNGRRWVEAVGVTDIAIGAIEGGTELIDGEFLSATGTVILAILESKAKVVVKPLKERAKELVKLNNNKNRVSITTSNGRINIDLDGKPHNVNGVDVDTPHVEEFQDNIIPSGTRKGERGSRSKKGDTRAATEGDIRMVRKILESRNKKQ